MELLIIAILTTMFLGAVADVFTSMTPEEHRKEKKNVD